MLIIQTLFFKLLCKYKHEVSASNSDWEFDVTTVKPLETSTNFGLHLKPSLSTDVLHHLTVYSTVLSGYVFNPL